jgi:hypothetical protein
MHQLCFQICSLQPPLFFSISDVVEWGVSHAYLKLPPPYQLSQLVFSKNFPAAPFARFTIFLCIKTRRTLIWFGYTKLGVYLSARRARDKLRNRQVEVACTSGCYISTPALLRDCYEQEEGSINSRALVVPRILDFVPRVAVAFLFLIKPLPITSMHSNKAFLASLQLNMFALLSNVTLVSVFWRIPARRYRITCLASYSVPRNSTTTRLYRVRLRLHRSWHRKHVQEVRTSRSRGRRGSKWEYFVEITRGGFRVKAGNTHGRLVHGLGFSEPDELGPLVSGT